MRTPVLILLMAVGEKEEHNTYFKEAPNKLKVLKFEVQFFFALILSRCKLHSRLKKQFMVHHKNVIDRKLDANSEMEILWQNLLRREGKRRHGKVF